MKSEEHEESQPCMIKINPTIGKVASIGCIFIGVAAIATTGAAAIKAGVEPTTSTGLLSGAFSIALGAFGLRGANRIQAKQNDHTPTAP